MIKRIILQGRFIFEPESKTIRNELKLIKISSSATFCLELMIKRVGELISHEEFYDYAWRRFGMEPTSASLYQNISSLRKCLDDIGLDKDYIKTMPRRGFILSSSLDIQIEEFDDQSVLLTEVEVTDEEEDECFEDREAKDSTIMSSMKNDEIKTKTKTKRLFQITPFSSAKSGTCIILLMIVTAAISLRLLISTENDMYIHVIKDEECNVMINRNTGIDYIIMVDELKSKKIPCHGNNTIYINTFKNANRYSIFECKDSIFSKKRANCQSYYFTKSFFNDKN